MSKKVGSRQTRGGRYFHAILAVFDQDRDKEERSFRIQKINIEGLEQIAAVIVTAALVAGNFLLFTPWRDGNDPRQRHQENRLNQKKSNQHLADSKQPSPHHPKHEDQQAMEDTESIHRNIKKTDNPLSNTRNINVPTRHLEH